MKSCVAVKQRRRYPLSLIWVKVPITFQETVDWGTYKLQLLSSQMSMVHIFMRENAKNEDLFESLTENICIKHVNMGPMGQPLRKVISVQISSH